MKLALAITALSAASIASAYNVGGFDTFGRPYFVSPRGRFNKRAFRHGRNGCAPQGNRECVDRAFEDLRKELKNDRFRGRGPPQGRDSFPTMDEESIRQQEEWVNRAFGLASDVAKGLASTPQEAKEAEDAIRQGREWADNAFGFARDISSGGIYSTVKAEVLQDDDQAYQVALDVPGVKADDITVTVEGTKDKILVIRGQRNTGGDEEARKFSKIISLDRRSETDVMSANLENGVLTVTVPRMAIENFQSVQKVTVNKVSDEAASTTGETDAFPFELEIDLPGVLASNIDITVEGDTDKTLKITAVREMGKDSEGNPRTKETSKSFQVDELVDTSKIVANLSNGVLKISAPADVKKTEESVRKIVVNESSDTDGSVEVSPTDDNPDVNEEDPKSDEDA